MLENCGPTRHYTSTLSSTLHLPLEETIPGMRLDIQISCHTFSVSEFEHCHSSRFFVRTRCPTPQSRSKRGGRTFFVRKNEPVAICNCSFSSSQPTIVMHTTHTMHMKFVKRIFPMHQMRNVNEDIRSRTRDRDFQSRTAIS